MNLNNLKIAVRRLLHQKGQSAILISGLTIGMATCILLLQYVSYELSFDTFHSKEDQIYRVINERFQNEKLVQKGAITYPTIGPTMQAEFPEIKNATRIAYSSDVMIIKDDQVSPVEIGFWVDEHFFEIFDFELLAGDRMSLLDEPNELVLPKSIADRYFPAAKGEYTAVIGKSLMIDRYNEPFKIVGVLEELPSNSHLNFELLLSYASCIKYWGEGAGNSWNWSDFYHYLELEPGTDVAALQAKFSGFSERHFRGAEVTGSNEVFSLQALSDIHLNSQDMEYEVTQTANGRAVWSLLMIAFFILFIAWINYVNLSSVRAIERAKEVGVRKVIGATKGQLTLQFLSEALMVNVLSLILALALVEIVGPSFANYFGLEVSAMSFLSSVYFNPILFASFIILISVGVLASGTYPAYLLSATRMSNVLKGNFARNIGGANLRKALVVTQFTLSIGLIAGVWLVKDQIQYMSQKDLGIDIDQVMSINSPEMTGWDSTFIDQMNTLKTEFSKIPGIESASTSSRVPGERMARVFNVRKRRDGNSAQTFSGNILQIDHDYAQTYSLNPIAGRSFRRGDYSQNIDEISTLLLNTAAVKMLGYPSPESAVGAVLDINDKDWTIAGVLPDFHQQSLHHSIEPIFFVPFYSTYNAISLRLTGDQNLDQTIAAVKATYARVFPGNDFSYQFIDEQFQNLYESEIRFGRILSLFTFLTVVIACLGLFGLASYMTFLRTKEIGVRKVLGASVFSIVALLSKDFFKLIVISILLAAPLAYLFLDMWLEEFAYRINIQWWVFLIAGAIAISVAFLTVSYQSIKAAMVHPIKSLRSE
jgi:putative ABC transport system permease protein